MKNKLFSTTHDLFVFGKHHLFLFIQKANTNLFMGLAITLASKQVVDFVEMYFIALTRHIFKNPSFDQRNILTPLRKLCETD